MKRALLAGFLAVALALGAAVAWLALRDPLGALPQAAGPLTDLAGPAERRDGRLVRHHVLETSALGPIGFTLSLPDPLPDRPLPVLIVVGGLGSGAATLRHVPQSGANAFIGYDWPLPRTLPEGAELLGAAPGLYRQVLAVPGQIAATAGWLAGRPWADAERISLLGFSLGALVVPAAQRIVQTRGRPVAWTVLAYGGADLGRILAEHPKAGLGPARPLVEAAADLLLRPIEPAEHLPHLSGRFLLIGGTEDRLVPRASAELMRRLTPEPKSVVLLAGAHVGRGSGRRALMQEIVEVTGHWLVAQGAAEPP